MAFGDDARERLYTRVIAFGDDVLVREREEALNSCSTPAKENYVVRETRTRETAVLFARACVNSTTFDDDDVLARDPETSARTKHTSYEASMASEMSRKYVRDLVSSAGRKLTSHAR